MTSLPIRCALRSLRPLRIPISFNVRSLQSTITLVEVNEGAQKDFVADESNGKEKDGCSNSDKSSQCTIPSKHEAKLRSIGIEELNELQCKFLPLVTQGKDVVVQAPTGSGKAVVTTLSLLEHAQKKSTDTTRKSLLGLVLTPTAERATHIQSLVDLLKEEECAVSCVVGGYPIIKQEAELRRGVDLVVGTPGRILDHIDNGTLDLSMLKHLIIDSADLMSNMGLEKDMDEILIGLRGTDELQTCLFTEGLPTWIRDVMKKHMNSDVRRIDQSDSDSIPDISHIRHRAIECAAWEQLDVIKKTLQEHPRSKILISTRSRKASKELVKSLQNMVNLRRIHDRTEEKDREYVLNQFWVGSFNCLIITENVIKEIEPDLAEVDVFIQTEPLSNADEYIKCSHDVLTCEGGENVVLYKRDEHVIINEIESKAGVQFSRYVAVQQDTIHDVVEECRSVLPETIASFLPFATSRLRHEGDIKHVIASALVLVAERNRFCSSSVLMDLKGYRTYHCTQDWELVGTERVVSILSKHFDEKFIDSMQGIQTCVDCKSCVFDVPVGYVSDIEEKWRNSDTASLRPIDDEQTLASLLKPRAAIVNEIDGSPTGKHNVRSNVKQLSGGKVRVKDSNSSEKSRSPSRRAGSRFGAS